MRLTNTEPKTLVGKTIIFRHQFWRVDGVTENHLELSKHCRPEKGKLGLYLLSQTRLYPTDTFVSEKYPRLTLLLRETCLLTTNEAVSAIQGYLVNGGNCAGCEAVAHIGGALAAIRHAVSHRQYARPARIARNNKLTA